MYAIFVTGGKQYRVQAGDVIDVDLIDTDQTTLKFDQVLLYHDGENAHITASVLAQCSVHAELIGNTKGPKVIAFKYKRRKDYRRTVGHRQKYTRVKIVKIAAA